jgi:transcriptional regulator with XRE-family HTH domain
MSDTIYSSPLLDCVAKLVRNRPASLPMHTLAEEIGVTRVWLTAFKNGRANNPSAVVVERLYVRLTGKQLIND